MEVKKKVKCGHYDGYKPIMWDLINISSPAFSNFPVQTKMWSDYYGKNRFKGDIFFNYVLQNTNFPSRDLKVFCKNL